MNTKTIEESIIEATAKMLEVITKIPSCNVSKEDYEYLACSPHSKAKRTNEGLFLNDILIEENWFNEKGNFTISLKSEIKTFKIDK